MATAKEKALLYLSRFSRTEKQVKDYLKRKGFLAEEIQETVVYLREHAFLNDSSFAEAFIQSKIRHCDGPLKIKQMLFQKGIAPAIADEMLRQYYPEEVQIEAVQTLMEKRSRLAREKLFRFIASRGFPRYVIIQAFKSRNL